jgi:hypothetical protein
MKRMSKREKLLMIVTVVAAMGAILYQFGFSKIYEAFSSTAGELAEMEQTYEEYVKNLDTKEKIEAAYREIEDQFPKPEKDKSPDKQFSEDIAALCSKLGFNYPKIDPPKDEEIEGVDDYKFITITIVTRDKLESIAKMLKSFAAKSLLIKDLSLSTSLDSDQVIVTVTVARIAKVPESEIKRISKEKSSRKKGTSGARRSELF